MEKKYGRLRKIPDLDGYKVDKYGNVWSDKTKHYLSPSCCSGYDGYKYPVVTIQVDGQKTSRRVAHLVLAAFQPKCGVSAFGKKKLHMIEYIDGDTTNNCTDNLRVVDMVSVRNSYAITSPTDEDKTTARDVPGLPGFKVSCRGIVYRANGSIVCQKFIGDHASSKVYFTKSRGVYSTRGVPTWKIVIAAWKPELGVPVFGPRMHSVTYKDGNAGNCCVGNLVVVPYRARSIRSKNHVVDEVETPEEPVNKKSLTDVVAEGIMNVWKTVCNKKTKE